MAGLLTRIEQSFATDQWPGLMLWRDEQRAVGGKCTTSSPV